MKKTYICPQIEEIKLKVNQTLLAGSVDEEASTATYSNDDFESSIGFE
jgi:hypothetical protein